MPHYFDHVELYKASSIVDYQGLHNYMADVGFSTIILADGVKYQLPTSEYYIEHSGNSQAVFSLAHNAAKATGRTFSLIVTQSADTKFELPVVQSH